MIYTVFYLPWQTAQKRLFADLCAKFGRSRRCFVLYRLNLTQPPPHLESILGFFADYLSRKMGYVLSLTGAAHLSTAYAPRQQVDRLSVE